MLTERKRVSTIFFPKKSAFCIPRSDFVAPLRSSNTIQACPRFWPFLEAYTSRMFPNCENASSGWDVQHRRWTLCSSSAQALPNYPSLTMLCAVPESQYQPLCYGCRKYFFVILSGHVIRTVTQQSDN
eukprot:1347942-Amorphochlora_amoeboformis.AAC.1